MTATSSRKQATVCLSCFLTMATNEGEYKLIFILFFSIGSKVKNAQTTTKQRPQKLRQVQSKASYMQSRLVL